MPFFYAALIQIIPLSPESDQLHLLQILLEGKSVDDTLINISTAYKFCGYEILDGFASFDVMKNLQVKSDIKALKERLKELC